MVRYKIEIDRNGCIACGTCYTLDPSHFESDTEGKSQMVRGETEAEKSSGTFEDNEIDTAREAETACPVSVITVTETVISLSYAECSCLECCAYFSSLLFISSQFTMFQKASMNFALSFL